MLSSIRCRERVGDERTTWGSVSRNARLLLKTESITRREVQLVLHCEQRCSSLFYSMAIRQAICQGIMGRITTFSPRLPTLRRSQALMSSTTSDDNDSGHELSTHVSSDGLTPRMVDVGIKVRLCSRMVLRCVELSPPAGRRGSRLQIQAGSG